MFVCMYLSELKFHRFEKWKELGPQTAKLALSICLEMKVVELV